MRIPTTRIQNTPPVGIPSAEYTTALKLLAQANKSRVARRRRSWINSRLSSLRLFHPPFSPSLLSLFCTPRHLTALTCAAYSRRIPHLCMPRWLDPSAGGPLNFPREKLSMYRGCCRHATLAKLSLFIPAEFGALRGDIETRGVYESSFGSVRVTELLDE